MVALVNNAAGITTTTGLDDLAINGSMAGFAPIIGNPAITNGTVVAYKVRNSDGTEFESGSGAWNSAINTIARTTIETSSNGGSKTVFSTGQKEVFIVPNVVSVTDMDNMVEGTSNKIMTQAERDKLNSVETGATTDQTGAEIKSLYEAQANTNAFTDAEKTKLTSTPNSFIALPSGAPVFVVGTGQSNMVGTRAPSSPVTANANVLEWQTPNVASPTTYSWQVADPNRETGYVSGQRVTGLPGQGTVNALWAYCDQIQRATGRTVYMLMVAQNGRPISDWADGASIEAELSAQLNAIQSEGTLSGLGITYPHRWIWSQGVANYSTPAAAYKDAWIDFKNLMETEQGGKDESVWFFMEPALAGIARWEGHLLVDRFTNDHVQVISTTGYDLDGSLHYTGDLQIKMGQMLAAKDMAGGWAKSLQISALNNFTATTAPLAGNDILDGYSVGSLWFNTSTSEFYQCFDNAEDAADWRKIMQDFGRQQVATIGTGTGENPAPVEGRIDYTGALVRGRSHKRQQIAVTTGATGFIPFAPMIVGEKIFGTMEIFGYRTDVPSDADVYRATVIFGSDWYGAVNEVTNSAVTETTHDTVGVTVGFFFGVTCLVATPASETWQWRATVEWQSSAEE